VPHAEIGIVAGLLASVSVAPYITSILRGTTRPARTTYIVKSAIGLLLLISYVQVGARSTAWTVLVYAVSPLIILALSVRRGVGGWTPLDRTCLAAALVGFGLWHLVGRPVVAVYTGTLIKWVALLPTLAKLRSLPGSESRTSWGLAFLGDALNLFALSTLQPAIALPVLNELVMCAAVLAIMSWTTGRDSLSTRDGSHPPPRNQMPWAHPRHREAECRWHRPSCRRTAVLPSWHEPSLRDTVRAADNGHPLDLTCAGQPCNDASADSASGSSACPICCAGCRSRARAH
jgi:hypothetical protein